MNKYAHIRGCAEKRAAARDAHVAVVACLGTIYYPGSLSLRDAVLRADDEITTGHRCTAVPHLGVRVRLLADASLASSASSAPCLSRYILYYFDQVFMGCDQCPQVLILQAFKSPFWAIFRHFRFKSGH
jgi:hypothetical protein